jgi:hypothetical protein
VKCAAGYAVAVATPLRFTSLSFSPVTFCAPLTPPLQVLRETGCLNGVLCTDASKSDEELVTMTKNWTIVGQDLLKVVRQGRALGRFYTKGSECSRARRLW